MPRIVAAVPVMLLVVPLLARADAGDCLAIWVDTRAQPAECAPVGLPEALDHQPDVCRAPSAGKAALTVKLTSCREQLAAIVPPPGQAVSSHEHVIQAQVTEGKQTKELTARDSRSWADALRTLCRAIVTWHGEHAGSR
jgi:hypothetical protein